MRLHVEFIQNVFSPRVQEAVKRLASGDSYKEAARELDVDTETVKSYASVFRKELNARNTLEGISILVARGVIKLSEIDKKTLITCGLIILSGSHSDYLMAKTVRASKTTRMERRNNEIAQPENGGEMVHQWHQRLVLCGVVPNRLSSTTVRERQEVEAVL